MREFYSKYQKSEEMLASFLFLFFLWLLIEVYLLNGILYLLNTSNKTLKKYWKMEKKIREKSGKFVSPKMWEPWFYSQWLLISCVSIQWND